MANEHLNDQRTLHEFGNIIVDYSDGDVAILDHISNLKNVYPLKTMKNLIAICVSGSISMQIGDQKTQAKQNDVIFFPPNLRIDQFECSPDFECKLISLSDHVIQGLLHDKISIWNHAVYVNNLNIIATSKQCRDDFSLYYGLIKSKINSKAPHEIVQALVRTLLLELCLILEKSSHTMSDTVKQSQGKTLFNRFLNLIAGNEVKRRPISHYASLLAITPKYLTMLCLKYSNKTASEWIVQYTIEDIRFYLRNSNLSIKEISGKLGFANMSHFGSYVRKYLGVSPSDYRHGK